MTTFTYSAVDAAGKSTQGTLQSADQTEALKRIKEMGFFPVKVSELNRPTVAATRAARHAARLGLKSRLAGTEPRRVRGRVKARQLSTFTRQLATLLDAGMPLLRGLRLLEEQETHPPLKQITADIAAAIEGGNTLSEALGQHPKVFNRLYLNMVKAGELGGTLEISLLRLADFSEKTERMKRKVKAAMAYPAAVVAVAVGVLTLLLVYIVPKFEDVFASLMEGRPLPAFTRLVLAISHGVADHFLVALATGAVLTAGFACVLRTRPGRSAFDRCKLGAPVFGPVIRKSAIARFTRTLGTLVTSGVPILQALTIVKDSMGNVLLEKVIGQVHENVKTGGSIVGPIRQSRIFPVLVTGMVDVGEQTGALPEMLHKIADNYDEEVDASVSAMMSLLEPVMIVLLAVVVGSIVIAMFLPIIVMINEGFGGRDAAGNP